MSIDTKTLEKIKSLRTDAHKLATFHDLYDKKYASDSSCDKKGRGFGCDSRFSAFKVNTSFDSKAGYYGNSGCSSILHVSDDVSAYFVKAMNLHQKELFATTARLMREDASALTDKAAAELEALQQMLTVARADAPEGEQAA